MIKELTIENIEREVLDSSKPAVVKFSSENCHLCVALDPVTERLHTKYKDKFNFYNDFSSYNWRYSPLVV